MNDRPSRLYKSRQPALDPDLSGSGTSGDHARLIACQLAAEWNSLSALRVSPAMAALAAARVAAQYAAGARLTVPPGFAWLAVMAADAAPDRAKLISVWQAIATLHTGASEPATVAELDRVIALWPVLGTADAIMETGGDIRLQRDPQSDLNGYGCSHSPRPWAVTFASSTASSVSERGYAAADRARVRLTAAMLANGDRGAIARESGAIRRAIARAFGIGAGSAVLLAASGTDSELLTLALSHLTGVDQPITTILLAPEETGSGVPMAARGRHFAIDTANGHAVSREAAIAGFRGDTELIAIGLRDATGAVRAAKAVEHDIIGAVAAAAGAGRRAILHVLDLSKTGLLAPSLALLRALRALHGAALDIVVDACQTRLAPARVRDYLALDAVVQITGSKFLTGPPFAGAVLLPPAIARRLARGRLPAGLDAYSGRADFPATATAARFLPDEANYGLVLRWRAALAEYRAFAAVGDARKALVLERFAATVETAIAAYGIFRLLPIPLLVREGDRAAWDGLRSVFAFAVTDPGNAARCLDPVVARQLYHWLNADCSAVFEAPAERRLAATICHIGQPVALANDADGRRIGWLRVSAGARLVAGEPAHRGLGPARRLDREMDDLAAVFAKIALLHGRWSAIEAADPQARYG